MTQSAAASSMSAFVASRRRQLITAFVVFALIALVPRFVSDVYMMNVLILTLLFAAGICSAVTAVRCPWGTRCISGLVHTRPAFCM